MWHCSKDDDDHEPARLQFSPCSAHAELKDDTIGFRPLVHIENELQTQASSSNTSEARSVSGVNPEAITSQAALVLKIAYEALFIP